MKTIRTIALLALFISGIFAFSSCNKDEDGDVVISVDGKAAIALEMKSQGDTKTVTVRGNKAWFAEATDWITVEPKVGVANRDITVVISVEANPGEERIGSVVFTLPDEEFAMVSVVQPQADLNRR